MRLKIKKQDFVKLLYKDTQWAGGRFALLECSLLKFLSQQRSNSAMTGFYLCNFLQF